MKTRIILLLVITALAPAFAQKKHKEHKENPESSGPRTAENARNFTELFDSLERDFTTFIQKHDTVALDQLLAPEFIARSAIDPDHIISRSDWLQKVVPNAAIGSFQQSGMSIRVFPGDVALVSFVQSQHAAGDTGPTGKLLIVDVWIANHVTHKWQPAQRYWSEAPASP